MKTLTLGLVALAVLSTPVMAQTTTTPAKNAPTVARVKPTAAQPASAPDAVATKPAGGKAHKRKPRHHR